VLAARDGDRWLVLDNRWNTIVSLKRFRPLFVVDADGVRMLTRPFRIGRSEGERTAHIARAMTLAGLTSRSSSLTHRH